VEIVISAIRNEAKKNSNIEKNISPLSKSSIHFIMVGRTKTINKKLTKQIIITKEIIVRIFAILFFRWMIPKFG
jgi:hypothetical protein